LSLASSPQSTLPHCPKCADALLRPDVVWFGEPLPHAIITAIEEWIQADPVDLILIIGTSLNVWPAADYVELAREMGASAAIVNTNRDDEPPTGLQYGDWFFEGDAAVVVPQILKGVIGDMDHFESHLHEVVIPPPGPVPVKREY